ncbi:uncharacterized protein BXZ73DRAFT_92497 [Epithele typhae]|uniref:uncharacterized protein n=1 Tax=Epithele typhae TaxID=378194 RepID=UPI00200740B4|nr:uncharacterized protein BXZ73DRAFT_92497 [Epithele typhae]KAH9916393.1 hypothetical protein BXZ73DRAFT_92497 [Epithele typhae]
MSRLIVKNLPAYLTQDGLRKRFEASDGPGGTLTDVKLVLKPDGTSRRFGFVGYKSPAEAERVRKWFNRAYIDSSRITVDIVDGVKDAPTPRPNKRPRLGPSPSEAGAVADATSKPAATKKGKQSSGAQLDEFMQVMQPRTKKGPSWKDDDPVVGAVSPDASSVLPKKQRKKAKDEPESLADQETPVDTMTEAFRQTSRLFLRNLAFTCTEDELRDLFQAYGEVSQVHLVLDSNSKQPKGLAYRSGCFEALDKTSFQGRLLHILPAVDRRGKKRTVKQDREAKRKATAGKEFNWAMLYMNSDAVVASIADRMKISKADILNPESENAAVKLALAETHVIQETKTFLEQHGVEFSSLEPEANGGRRPARSDHILLVKNIPYGTSAADVRALFEPHGALRRVLVPPAGTLAVVEFEHADEGRKAFRAVAYRRLGNSIVYLEKGPEGLFLTDEPMADITSADVSAALVPAAAAAEGEQGLAAGTTLFVKNLAFSTTAERLTQVARHLPEFAFARVQTKADPARPGVRLSMGYGFVGFKTAAGAQRGLKALDGTVLDGHKLAVKFAGRGAEESTADKETVKARTTKMIVKNVPFEATKKDIRELFGAHAQLKSVRLPRKFDHRTRGFAFLDFTTRHEAERAYATLRHTHFLGRHLVLEWAEEGEADVEKLREKAGVSFGGGAEMPGRKRKLDLATGRTRHDLFRPSYAFQVFFAPMFALSISACML